MNELWGGLKCNTCLNEADVFSVLPEALAAHVEPVFADQSVSVRAYPAGMNKKKRLIYFKGPGDLNYMHRS